MVDRGVSKPGYDWGGRGWAMWCDELELLTPLGGEGMVVSNGCWYARIFSSTVLILRVVEPFLIR